MILKQFFAVTGTSVYKCFIDRKRHPQAVKIAMREGCQSKIRVGGFLGSEPPSFRPLVISSGGGIQIRNGNTSPIVALFLEKSDALKCLKSGDAKPWSRDWRKLNQNAIEAIGSNHHLFRFEPTHPIFHLVTR